MISIGIQREERSRIEVIDCFRGLAILSVMLYHFTYRWGAPDRKVLNFDISWFSRGGMGVDLFFVVSGFVIFMTLEKCPNWTEFAVRRLARIYPTFLVCLLITFTVMNVFGLPQFQRSLEDLTAGVFIRPLNGHWIDGVYWSLEVEMKFYFWIGALYFACPQYFVRSWLAFAAFDTLVEFIFPSTGVALLSGFGQFFTLGIAYYLRFKRHKLDSETTALMALALISYIALWGSRGMAVHAMALAIFLLFEAFAAGWLNWLPRTGLAFVGLVSYPLYLLHQNIGVSAIARISEAGVLSWVALAFVTVSLLAAYYLLHIGVERPIQRSASHYFRKPAAIVH